MKKMFWMLCLLSLHITAQTVGENGATDDYTYDASGNLIRDANKNITNITYNHLNLPVVITFSNGDKIVYLYNAVGEKRQKKVTVGDKTTVTDYLGGFQYEDGELKFFQHEEGYVAVTNSDSGMDFTYVYNYTDHLGNVRLSWAKDNTTDALKIIRESHYYPYGLEHKGYNTQKYAFIVPENGTSGIWTEQKKAIVNPYRYSYNGKEFQHELRLNLYDYGARNYDPAIGRWMNIDPLAEKSRRFSPYVYALDNPVYFIDPDGMQAISTSNIYDDRIQMTTAVGNDDIVTKVSNTKNKGTYVQRDISIGMTLTVVNSNGADLSKTMFNKSSGMIEFASMSGIAQKDHRSSDVYVSDNLKNVSVSYKVVSSLKDVGKNDHVMMLVNNIPVTKDGTNPLGLAIEGGRVSAVEIGTIKNNTFNETAQHEIGHNLGLDHRNGGLMNKTVNGSISTNSLERGNIIYGQVGPLEGNGIYTESQRSDNYKTKIKTQVNKFLGDNNID